MDLRKLSEPIDIPSISPLEDDGPRPTWSVMIPTYRRPKTLQKTIRSILAQDLGPEDMQIHVVENPSDQCSEEQVKEWGQGRVEYSRHEENLGMVGNWNACIEKARGHWVHILHDDDEVAPGYYEALNQWSAKNPELGMMACRAIGIDENDEWLKILFSPPSMSQSGLYDNAFRELCENCWIVCPSAVVKRSVYERLGGFSPSYECSTDWDMWLRIARAESMAMIWHPYLRYRIHSDAITDKVVKNGRLFEEAFSIIRRHSQALPEAEAKTARERAFAHFGRLAEHHSRLLIREKKWDQAAKLADYVCLFQPSLKNQWNRLRRRLRAWLV